MDYNIENQKKSFLFNVSGENGIYQVRFLTNKHGIEIDCDCGATQKKNCWHAHYVLSGRTSRIVGGDTEFQEQLIAEAKNTKSGSAEIRRARRRFSADKHCRRCNSERIVKVKYSLVARFFMLFKESKHTYFCKECKWTW